MLICPNIFALRVGGIVRLEWNAGIRISNFGRFLGWRWLGLAWMIYCTDLLTWGTGSILLAFIAILVSLALLWRSDKKHAAVGRRYGFPQP